MEDNKILIRKISLASISCVHPEVADIAVSFSELFMDAVPETLSSEAVEKILVLHPIHVTQDEAGYLLISGFRSYQLALANFELTDKFSVLVHKLASSDWILSLAQTDILASRIVHSLGSKPSTQIERLIQRVGPDVADRLVPGLCSNRSISKFLKS